MIVFGNSNSTPVTCIYSIQSQDFNSAISSSSLSSGSSSLGGESEICIMDSPLFGAMMGNNTSTEYFKIIDDLSAQRRALYSLLEESSLDDDSVPLSFFEEMRTNTGEFQAFGQIMKVFLGAYKKKDSSMVIKVLRFMQNFNYQEVGRVGLSATNIALLYNDNVDIQSAAISLVLRWKAKDFKPILDKYHAPNDIFIQEKLKRIAL